MPPRGATPSGNAKGVGSSRLPVGSRILVRVLEQAGRRPVVAGTGAGPRRGRGAAGPRSAQRPDQGDGRRLRLPPQPVQPGPAGPPPARLGDEAADLRGGPRQGVHPGDGGPRCAADLPLPTAERRTQGVGAAELFAGIRRTDHRSPGPGEIEQHRHHPHSPGNRRPLCRRLCPPARHHLAAAGGPDPGPRFLGGDPAGAGHRLRYPGQRRHPRHPDLHHQGARPRRQDPRIDRPRRLSGRAASRDSGWWSGRAPGRSAPKPPTLLPP